MYVYMTKCVSCLCVREQRYTKNCRKELGGSKMQALNLTALLDQRTSWCMSKVLDLLQCSGTLTLPKTV